MRSTTLLVTGALTLLALWALDGCSGADDPGSLARHGSPTSPGPPVPGSAQAGPAGASDGPEAGPASATDAGPRDAAEGGASACLDGVASPGSGRHKSGQNCLGCHDNEAPQIRWTVAGSLFTQTTGGAEISGATIEIIDADNKKLLLKTHDNGNFYTTEAVRFPLTVRASKCPSDVPMVAKVSSGNCNADGCHNYANQMHMP